MRSMIDDGMMKLDQTTLAEIIRMVPHDMMKAFRERQHAQEDIDHLIANMTEQKAACPRPDDGPSTFLLSNPASERPAVDLIQSAFEELRSQEPGAGEARLDPMLFKEFIPMVNDGGLRA